MSSEAGNVPAEEKVADTNNNEEGEEEEEEEKTPDQEAPVRQEDEAGDGQLVEAKTSTERKDEEVEVQSITVESKGSESKNSETKDSEAKQTESKRSDDDDQDEAGEKKSDEPDVPQNNSSERSDSATSRPKSASRSKSASRPNSSSTPRLKSAASARSKNEEEPQVEADEAKPDEAEQYEEQASQASTGSGRLPPIKTGRPAGLNDFELTALQGLFDVYDKSGVGYITKAELVDLTEHIKHDSEAARDFAEPLELERDDAQVSFDQFAGLVAGHPDKALRNLIIHAGVVEFLQILTKYQQECEDQNNFMEAQRAAQQIKVLRQQEEGRQQMRLLYAQKQETYDATQARNEQIQLFNEKWDNYLQEFDRQAQDYIRQLSEKHKNALADFRSAKMAVLTRKPPKFSKKLLALRQKQEIHSKLKQYIDAKRIQDEADDLEDAELAKIERQRRKQYNRMEKNFRAEQNKELMALVDKIHMRREEHLCQRARDLVRLKQRNKNMKAVIHTRQVAQKKFASGAVKFSLDLKAKRPAQ